MDVITSPRRERVDAARSRVKILTAAAEIVATHGVEGLSMAEVAAAAGVGVGTLYPATLLQPGHRVGQPALRGVDLLAWEVDTLAELERIAVKLSEMNALVGASDHSTTKALYAKDPDGLEFEVSWLVPADLLTEDALNGRSAIKPW